MGYPHQLLRNLLQLDLGPFRVQLLLLLLLVKQSTVQQQNQSLRLLIYRYKVTGQTGLFYRKYMALKLKQNKTFIDASGNEYADPYFVIDQCNGNKKRREQYFTVEIYKDQQSRIDNLGTIYSREFVVKNTDWDTYFSVSAIQADNDQYSRAYDYIKQHKETEESNFLLKDWEDMV
jgi:hypothetical protein